MKKALVTLLMILLAFSVLGCGSKPDEDKTVGKDGAPRPEWVKKMSKVGDENIHYEVGYGKLSNYATSLKRAEADGRNKIALWIQADVNTVLKNYTQDSGIGDQRELIEFMEEVSMQTAKLSLNGATFEESWEDAEGGVYILMSYDINKAATNLQNQLKSYQRNEAAAFAEFKAQEAFKMLNATQEAEQAVQNSTILQ